MSVFSRLLSSTALVVLAATAAWAGSAGAGNGIGFDATRWKLEDGTAPSYAATEPTRTTVNLDAVVLACEATDRRHALQLQLYTVDEGPLRPLAASAVRPEDDPTAEIAIDGQVFPVSLMFTERYAVLADGERDRMAALSDRLLDAIQSGRSMTLRFDLVADGTSDRNDEAVIDLRSAGAREAIAAMRRCAGSSADFRVGAVGAASPTH